MAILKSTKERTLQIYLSKDSNNLPSSSPNKKSIKSEGKIISPSKI